MDILLEIKILIASFDQETWIKLIIWDENFRQFAYSEAGKWQFIDLFTVISTNKYHMQYTLFGKLHRNQLPAMIYTTGEFWWYYNGQLHRVDGPAIVYAHGGQIWYRNGQLYRDDRPAVVCGNRYRPWYLK